MAKTVVLILLFGVCFLILVLRKPLAAIVRGKKGELNVNLRLQLLPSEEYKVINNLLISSHGHTSQIDHVVVSEYGIFVIETKNYKGWIYGSDNSEYWTQNIYGKKYQLYNPIQQNQGHVRALRRILKDLPSDMFISIVAFSRQATLKNRYLDNVVYWNQISRVIRSYSQKHMSAEQVQYAYSSLLEANSTSKDSRKQHVHIVRGQIYRNYVSVSNGYCPRCGGKLVLRNGQYGYFYGCSNYPRCRYTHTT